MADQTKTINRAVRGGQRMVQWDNSTLASGDILRVENSLGRFGNTMTISASSGCDLAVVVNSRVLVLKNRQYPEQEPFGWIQSGNRNIATAVELDSGNPSIVIGSPAGTVQYVMEDQAIRDVKVTFTTGTFTLLFT